MGQVRDRTWGGQGREGGEKLAGDQGLRCHVRASEAVGSHGGL